MSNGGGGTAVSARAEGRHVVVVAEPGSDADGLLRDAERLLKEILRRLELSDAMLARPGKIVVRAGAVPAQAGRSNGQSHVGGPDGELDTVSVPAGSGWSTEALAEELAKVVLRRVATGESPNGSRHAAGPGGPEVQAFCIAGVARYLARQIVGAERRPSSGDASDSRPRTAGEVPVAEEVCARVAAERKWRLPLYPAMVRGPDADADPALHAAMQEAFGGYLLERDGPRELLRFLAAAGDDPNRAAEVTYGKPLELLEAEWLSGLRQGIGRKLVSLWGFLRHIYPYLKPYPWRQVELLALIVLSSIVVQIAPFQIRALLDMLASDAAKADPWGYGLPQTLSIIAVLSISSVVNITAIARLLYVVQVLGQNILRDLRLAYVERVNALSLGYFAGIRTGDLMARFTSDMGNLADPMARTIGYSLYYLVLIPITLVSMIIMSWKLTVLLVLFVPFYVVVSRWLGPMIQRATRSRQERLAQLNSTIEEMIYAHPVIQIFNLHSPIKRSMAPKVREFRRVEIRADFLRAVFEEVNDLTDLVVIRIVTICGAILVLAAYDPSVAAVIGFTTVGTIIGFSQLMGRFISPIHRLANIYASVSVAGARLRRVEEVLHQAPEDLGVPPGGTAEPPAVREGIRIEHVDFAYGTTPTLRDISVEIPAGTSAAFVGPTGAGKTTLVNMIPRFYEPASGSVKIDGRDVREHALPALRSRVALVSQETFLFNETIRDNILMGKQDATDDEIVAAAKAARIHDFVMSLPAGYDTIVGERGSRLSGGQRQRLAIARALLRGAPILILDEATSALDAETEAEILDELSETARGKTTISITHRLALAMRADRIYVLDRGRIVESGTHDELMNNAGLYKKLFDDQNEHLLKLGLLPTNGANGAGAPAAARTESVP